MSVEVLITKMYGNGRVTVPKEIREKLQLSDGDKVLWYVNDKGEVCIRKVSERKFREW